MILCFTSALEHHELFHGYFHEKKIDVYALEAGMYENVNYHVVNTFDGIDYEKIDNVFCTTISQTFNDMLANYDYIDELSLIEGLAKYYHLHGESYKKLIIRPENMDVFSKIKDYSVDFYDWG
jgi:hypothetical protein